MENFHPSYPQSWHHNTRISARVSVKCPLGFGVRMSRFFIFFYFCLVFVFVFSFFLFCCCCCCCCCCCFLFSFCVGSEKEKYKKLDTSTLGSISATLSSWAHLPEAGAGNRTYLDPDPKLIFYVIFLL